jgi:hypothetical protein
MCIPHKNGKTDWSSGFATHNAILDETPYEPEVLILGTFNPDTPNANFSDFFYGRNYFWPAFTNLFVHNRPVLVERRIAPNAKLAPVVLQPRLEEIFELCSKLKLCFADLISEVLHKGNPHYQVLANDNVLFNDKEYNLIQDGKAGGILGLDQLDSVSQVRWNTQNIIDFLVQKPSIKAIYFTRKPSGIWGREFAVIQNTHRAMECLVTNIFTPSGQGLRGKPRMNSLLKHWVSNTAPGFGRLDNKWLVANNVTINHFQ